jgi:hypothetical protein
VKNMSLESLGCLESLVPSKPSKPSEPTLTSNQRLRLHHSSLALKTGIGNIGYWQHSSSSTNQKSLTQTNSPERKIENTSKTPKIIVLQINTN